MDVLAPDGTVIYHQSGWLVLIWFVIACGCLCRAAYLLPDRPAWRGWARAGYYAGFGALLCVVWPIIVLIDLPESA